MSLMSLSSGYRSAARHLRKQLKTLRARYACCEDPFERSELHRKIKALEPILAEMNALADLTAHYYDRGYPRNAKYRL